jgi:hypothetical protein
MALLLELCAFAAARAARDAPWPRLLPEKESRGIALSASAEKS